MSEQQISVQPGTAPTTLVMALGSGSTIQNNDSANAVWVSTNAGLIAGTGTRIGPKGSLAWTTPGATVFAVVDTGVTTPVALSVSSDIAQPVNPVDIGVAVATQLLQQGVPNVLVGEYIPDALAGNIDVSDSGSISIQVTAFGETLITTSFYAVDGVGGTHLMGGRDYVISSPGVMTFTEPVSGPIFSMADTGLQLSSANGYKSNRILPDAVSNVTKSSQNNLNQAFVSGTKVSFNAPITTNGGWHNVRLAVTGAGNKGFLVARLYSNNGISGFYDAILLDTGMGHTGPQATVVTEVETQIILPPGKIEFYYLPQNSATYQAVFQIIPTS